MTFEEELTALVNKYSVENLSDTPDFILAAYICDCLHGFNEAVKRRELWYGRHPKNGLDKLPSTP